MILGITRDFSPQKLRAAFRTLLFAAVVVAPFAAHAQSTDFNDEFDGTALDAAKWTPVSLTFNHAGTVSVSDGAVTISYQQDDPNVGDSRFGIMSNAVFGKDATIEATVDSWEGTNAILRLQGRNGAFVEVGLDANPDTPIHVWRSYPDDDKNFNGGAGIAAPLTFRIKRTGDTLALSTVSNGQETAITSEPVAGLGDDFRIFLYGFAGSTTTWSSVTATGALPTGTITGSILTASGQPAEGARVSVGDTLFQPVLTDASGAFSLPVLAGDYTVTASALNFQPATTQVTVTAGQAASVDLQLSPTQAPPVYDTFDGPTLDTSKWQPVTVEGQGVADLQFANSELIMSGSPIQSWRRNGLMSTRLFNANYSVAQFKLDPNPNGEPWHPFVALWDGAGIPSWNTQPHVEVEFRSDINRLQLNGGRAPFVSQEADQLKFAPLDTADLPAILTIVRTGNTFDFYIRTKSETTDRLAFSTTTSNLTGNHRIVIYSFTPDPNGENVTTSTWDYVAASNMVAEGPGTLTGKVTANGQAVANAGVLVTTPTNTFTARTDANGNYSLSLIAGSYSATAVAYGYDRAATAPVQITADTSQTHDFALSPSTLTIPPAAYDDFNGTEVDMSKWKSVNEAGTDEGTASEADGELVLQGPGAPNRWGLMTTGKLPAAGSVSEVVVNNVDDFGPGAVNAIMQLYTGDGGFNRFIEFGIETRDANGLPILHVWGPESGDYAASAPSDFPITLTAVRHGNDLDFFANKTWFHSVTTSRLEGDHSVFLYGFGASIPHFDSLSASSGGVTPPPATLGDLNADAKVNAQDATISIRIAVGLVTPTDAQKAAGDVNKDGKLNTQDTTLILRFAVGLISQFPGQ